MQITEVEISKIKSIENSRTTSNDIELAQLMSSIQQHGLEHPIGISPKDDNFIMLYGHRRLLACKKLGWTKIPVVIKNANKVNDILSLNIIENVQRKNLSPYEVGRIVSKLVDEKMNLKEIAVRLSIPLSRVKNSLEQYNHIPKGYQSKIKFMDMDTNREGKLPAYVVKAILDLRRQFTLNKAQVQNLMKTAIDNHLTNSDMSVIAHVLDNGQSVSNALKKAQEYRTVRIDVLISNDNVDKLVRKHKKSIRKIIADIVYGDETPISRPKF